MKDLAKPSLQGFSHVFPAHVEAFSRLLIDLRRIVGGDLDLILILAVIGERHFARRVDPDLPTEATLGTTETNATPSINTLSVADYTGIPRETVRRKIATLIERGWVQSDTKGNLSPTSLAAYDLSEGTEVTIAFLAAAARMVPPSKKSL